MEDKFVCLIENITNIYFLYISDIFAQLSHSQAPQSFPILSFNAHWFCTDWCESLSRDFVNKQRIEKLTISHPIIKVGFGKKIKVNLFCRFCCDNNFSVENIEEGETFCLLLVNKCLLASPILNGFSA